MWVTRATYTVDSYVDITYTKWSPGTGYTSHDITVETWPEGNWTHLEFDFSTSLIHFLNVMVNKTIDVSRKIAELSNENLAEKYQDNNEKLNELMNAISILDPTFSPPVLNMNCRWQMELLYDIVINTSYRVIVTCKNKKNLDTYFKTLEML